MPKVIPDVTCPFCGTLCDDLEITVTDDNKKIISVRNACAIGAEKFNHTKEPGQGHPAPHAPARRDVQGSHL